MRTEVYRRLRGGVAFRSSRFKRGLQLAYLLIGVLVAVLLLVLLLSNRVMATLAGGGRSKRDGGWSSSRYIPFPASKLPAANVPIGVATIFVSIASFRDVECLTTVESLLTQANNSHRIFLGISEERFGHEPSCVNAPLIFKAIGIERNRTLRWRDVVPSAFVERSKKHPPPPMPILHAGRDTDLLTCYVSKSATMLHEGKQVGALKGCQIVTRVGDPDDARGPTYGRYLTSVMYTGQDYYLVVDSHTRVVPDWDSKMIRFARLMPTRGVLSHYPNGYTPQDPDKELSKDDIMSMCTGVIPPTNIPKLGAQWVKKRDHPFLQSFVAAGFIFGDAQFVKDVPFDPYLPYLFEGEEILYTTRLWTSGWDSYCPGDAFLYHNYDRPKAPRFWSVVYNSKMKEQRMYEERIASMRVLYLTRRHKLNSTVLEVSHADAHKTHPAVGYEEERFGMGHLRPIHEYWKFAELSDEFTVAKDNEGRWTGGRGLCNRAV
ncbi:putative Glycosyltransferase (GlcNAc) [Trypanosoma vivax]|uniref:Glycosyltransferase (GlcNAc) n=1 Tax=Trypanosoma vivax (strain Y486) TaxID=1055687 RepID=G0TVJ7_TRYVY|nr:hypothetical protein TRVL_00263 [Trypanosoma vivax]KAH8620557.1 putative Glycosyltransferase (GlcNAc) [Trypanosoma vivax]CCC47963.1 conserved hypothetical protein [Trypanosoma vivax Y486]